MPTLATPEVQLAYELDGRVQDPVVVLLHGLGGQLIDWDEEVVRWLVQGGLCVLRFDARDSGLSSHLSQLGAPSLPDIFAGAGAPYGLSDMAADLRALTGALGIGRVHLLGVSLGAMVAQRFAIDYPGSTLSLASLLGSTGAAGVGGPEPELLSALANGEVRSGEELAVMVARPRSAEERGELAERVKAEDIRAPRDRAALMRQLAAVVAAKDRTGELASLDLPALVLHGTSDPLVAASGGVATWQALPRARLVLVAGLGHDLPTSVWPVLREEIQLLYRKAGRR